MSLDVLTARASVSRSRLSVVDKGRGCLLIERRKFERILASLVFSCASVSSFVVDSEADVAGTVACKDDALECVEASSISCLAASTKVGIACRSVILA